MSTGSFTGSFVGNLDGNLEGSASGSLSGSFLGKIYSPTGELILDNGTGPVSDSNFYGTASFAETSTSTLTSTSSSHALTSDTTISASHALTSDTTISASHSLNSDDSISSSYSLTSSYAENSESSSYSLTSAYAEKATLSLSLADGFPYLTDTLNNLLSPTTNYNVIYRYDHGLGSVPSMVRVMLYVSSNWTNSSGNVAYEQDQEIDINSLIIDHQPDNDGTPITFHVDETSVYISFNVRAGYTIDASTRIIKFAKPSTNNTISTYDGAGFETNVEWDKLKYKIYVWE
jgi:hypothetical protein